MGSQSTIKNSVDFLQNKLSYGKTYQEDFFLRYTKEGNVEAVTVVIYKNTMKLEIDLWDSENDERIFLEETNEYEAFEVYLKRKLKEINISLKEFRSVLK